jgi:8-oxo-dGTP diphosphatase
VRLDSLATTAENSMPLPHRISAGAIVLSQGRVLLVRYEVAGGQSILVAPGGGVEQEEPLADAAVRETREETGLIVAAKKPLAVENLLCSQSRLCKTWFLCDLVAGEVHATEGARQEGITEAGWFGRDDLRREVVFPSILMQYDWPAFASPEWAVKWLELCRATF